MCFISDCPSRSVAIFGLVPGQSRLALGLEFTVAAAITWTFCVTKQVQARSDPEALRRMKAALAAR